MNINEILNLRMIDAGYDKPKVYPNCIDHGDFREESLTFFDDENIAFVLNSPVAETISVLSENPNSKKNSVFRYFVSVGGMRRMSLDEDQFRRWLYKFEDKLLNLAYKVYGGVSELEFQFHSATDNTEFFRLVESAGAYEIRVMIRNNK